MRRGKGFRLWPRSLAGQMVLLVVAAVILAQVGAYVFFLDERRQAVRAIGREVTIERIDSLVRLLAETPPDMHEKVVKAASSESTMIRLEPTSSLDRNAVEDRFSRHLQKRLAKYGISDIRLGLSLAPPPPGRRWWRDGEDDDHEDHRDMMDRHHGGRSPPWWDFGRGPRVFAISMKLRDGYWLNVSRRMDPQPFLWALTGLMSLALTALAVALVVVVLVRRITKPVKALAQGADALGRGETVQHLPVSGAREVQQAVIAFNRMNDRLQRFVRDRLMILGALSHDLRTPLTTLRLRAEFITDEELKEKILETLQEMEDMAEATLAFVREEAKQEDSRPVALRRAFRNLIENAIKYGERCSVSWETLGKDLRIYMDDAGPGIPADRMEELFKPFVRLETSRSRDTGGVGMGLAIARMIIRGHGGDILLANRPEGGLRVTVILPIGETDGLAT